MPIFEGNVWLYKKGSLPRFSCVLAFISTGYTFLLILYERGMDDRSATKETLVPRSGLKKYVRRIMCVIQEAIRIPDIRRLPVAFQHDTGFSSMQGSWGENRFYLRQD